MGCFFFPSLSAGLDAAELASLNPSAFSFIRKSCIPLIPSSNFVVSAETCCNTHTHVPVYLNSFSPCSHSLLLSWSLWGPTTPSWLPACSGPLWEMSSWRLLSGPPPGPTTNRNQATRQVRGTQVSGVWLERKGFAFSRFPSGPGAPSLSIEGVSAFMKPFLFLLTGFLLL